MILQEIFSSYKIYAHQEELDLYKTGGNPASVSVEVHPSDRCPHNCIGCVDHIRRKDGRQNTILDLPKLVRGVVGMGCKAIVFSGGEPLVHKDFLKSVLEGSQSLDIGVITNGQLLTPDLSHTIKPRLSSESWIRISLNADGSEMHERYHRVSGKYGVIIDNIRALVKAPGNITIGIAFNTGLQTISGMMKATEIAKGLGVDYIQFRPFITLAPHDETESEAALQRNLEDCKRLEDENFKVIASTDKYEQAQRSSIDYSRCHAQQFASMVIAANGKVYACCYGSYLEKFCLGDAKSDDLKSIWESERRQQVISQLNPQTDCPMFCRFDGVNRAVEEFLQQSSPISQEEIRKIQSLSHTNFL